MAWRRPGDKPLSEPMIVSLMTHICVTCPQWVKLNQDSACVFYVWYHHQTSTNLFIQVTLFVHTDDSCKPLDEKNIYITLKRTSTVYPKKYAHGFVVLCFVVVMQPFIMNSHEVFIHIHQGCFAGTGAIVRLPQCQWSKPDGYGKISQCITTTKHSKAKTVCIFLGIYCIFTTHHYRVLGILKVLCALQILCLCLLTCARIPISRDSSPTTSEIKWPWLTPASDMFYIWLGWTDCKMSLTIRMSTSQTQHWRALVVDGSPYMCCCSYQTRQLDIVYHCMLAMCTWVKRKNGFKGFYLILLFDIVD